MSVPKEDDTPFSPELLSGIFEELVDCIIVDVASESHRIAKLGLDHHLDEEEEELRLSAEARARASHSTHSGESNGKNVVDIFGQTHSAVAGEIIECMNCSRSVVAGKFAPHLEKCMGKGRKARLKSTRSTTAAQNQFSRSSPISNTSRVGNGSGGNAGHDYSNGALEEQ